MNFSDYSWKYCPYTGISTEAYIKFYQGRPIFHGTHVPGPFDQSSTQSNYNTSCIAGTDLAQFSMLIYKLLNKDLDIFPAEAPLIV